MSACLFLLEKCRLSGSRHCLEDIRHIVAFSQGLTRSVRGNTVHGANHDHESSFMLEHRNFPNMSVPDSTNKRPELGTELKAVHRPYT